MCRRQWSLAAVTGILCIALPAHAAERGPIRIGYFASLSGPLAQAGRDMTDGFMLFWDEGGHQVAGRTIEVLVEDDQGLPPTSLAKVRQLVEQQQVHTVAGGIPSPSGYIVAPYVDQQKIPTVFPVTAPDDITQRRPARWVVRTDFAASQVTHPLGDYAYRVLGLRRVAIISMDFAFGWESSGGFQRVFEERGGQIVQRIWTPLTAQDYAPSLAGLKREVDGVFARFTGIPAQRFLKQWTASGLQGKVPLVGPGTLTDETILPGMGDEALTVLTALNYSAVLDTPANRRFATAFEKKFGRPPSLFAMGVYTGARFYAEAIRAIQGDVEDRERFLQALRSVELKDDPRGPLKMDDMGNPDQNIYLRKVERVSGKLQNTVFHTYPMVSQFWTYKREEYLKQPLYDRTYPPCRFCQ